MGYKLSIKAAADIEGIWTYTIKTWSNEQADRYLNLIFDDIEYLAANPLSGKDCSTIRKDYRCSHVKSHLIFYRYFGSQDDIEIVRVLHEKMDAVNRLIRPER